jgi:hypothetical protein
MTMMVMIMMVITVTTTGGEVDGDIGDDSGDGDDSCYSGYKGHDDQLTIHDNDHVSDHNYTGRDERLMLVAINIINVIKRSLLINLRHIDKFHSRHLYHCIVHFQNKLFAQIPNQGKLQVKYEDEVTKTNL